MIAANKHTYILPHNSLSSETPIRPRDQRDCLSILPSSPPIFKMPSVSSPIKYGNSPSPRPAKRIRTAEEDNVPKQRTIGGFVLDDSDEDDESQPQEPSPKRRLLETRKTAVVEAATHSPGRESSDVQKALARPAEVKRVGGFLINDDDEDNDDNDDSTFGADVQAPQSTSSRLVNLLGSSDSGHATTSLLSTLNRQFNLTEIQTCSGRSTNVGKRKKSGACVT